MRLIDFLHFLSAHGTNDKIDFVVLWVDGDFITKCHLDNLFYQRLEGFDKAFITVISYNCKQLHIEAVSDE